jgi:large subunit ribosomal protein L24e
LRAALVPFQGYHFCQKRWYDFSYNPCAKNKNEEEKLTKACTGKSFRFCRSKCHRNFKMKRNPRSLKWTKASRIKAGKEMVCDSTLLFGTRRDVPQRYNRDLVEKTIGAMKRISEIRSRRERAFYKKRMAGKRSRELADARKLVAENEHLLPRLRGSEVRRRQEAAAAGEEELADFSVLDAVSAKSQSRLFGGEKRRLRVRVDGQVEQSAVPTGRAAMHGDEVDDEDDEMNIG